MSFPGAMRRAALLALLLLGACVRGGPKAIDYADASCDYCRMVISDPRYGAELVTTTGKVHEFDSIECLASYYAQAREATVRSVWVSDFARPGTLISAATATFVRASGPASPMGKGLTAFAPGTDSATIERASGGTPTLRWDDVLALVKREATVATHDASPAPSAPAASRSQVVDVTPDGPVRTLGRALELARPGARIVVHPGTYREPTIVVGKPVEIVGEGLPVLDGEGQRQIMTVTAPNVTVRGLHFRNVGTSFVEDRAAIKVVETTDCVIEGNRVDDAFFGIYLARVSRCRIAGNTLHASTTTEAASGNGIHLWTADSVTIADNQVVGHRDGIYFEFVHDSDVHGNVSEGNLRYGLHFMYSNGCRYQGNTFRHNGSGVAVMYTKGVEMLGNRFEQNWGSAAYGLLLKEISDVRVERNRFSRNTTGLFADGTTRLTARGNEFADNGWALRIEANAQDGVVTGNDFIGNTFDVATNALQTGTTFDGNYFEAYGGYDLDRDGVGDVPHRPVRLFSVVVERNEPAMILLRSFFAGLLDASERLVPALTPETLVDAHPAMRRRAAP
ncbi:MAG TPA: nitrous oxide reductase family maturation protein NosD [Gemmatimonadaceae bacterium]|nr:nitrous oxide reductase family maturation protein NosD [Gemmatimonadaceae bacterium]